ncbi:hypothetical protein F3Y22_tig00002237pilonHSYRG00793 [Hibiscus syriacus]|uniref:RNase H type-1 domain-containing protein n=1 Tax=Hibiscus syriacus TaxID=106335 RepID=A0A6A3CY50_HIBSY|nr:hypothetical protein F3Y22_tig00002237pilonHSYRG00793 [Hibiscus syriacus]
MFCCFARIKDLKCQCDISNSYPGVPLAGTLFVQATILLKKQPCMFCVTVGKQDQFGIFLFHPRWLARSSLVIFNKSRLCSTNDHHHAPQPISWQAPDPGWICMNVDGAVNSTTKHGTIGGVFRDHEGRLLLEFNKSIGIMQPLQAELWAIYTGLHLSWENGFEFLLIQTDSLEATKLLNQTDVAFSSLSLVRAIDKLRRYAWATFINWIQRKGNILADALAKSADLSNRNPAIFENPSYKFCQLLDADNRDIYLM